VLDNCAAIDVVLRRGREGEVYNIGGGNERTNREITSIIIDELGLDESIVERVADRPGHDRRYSITCGKARTQLGWEPVVDFESGLRDTIRWYAANPSWWEKIKHQTSDFADWRRLWYEERA
jgi:dTDP-glucose 4,6-dehydratase